MDLPLEPSVDKFRANLVRWVEAA